MTTPASPPGLREDYENSVLTLAILATRYDLTQPEITKFRRAEGWTPRPCSIADLKVYRLADAVLRLTAPETKAAATSPRRCRSRKKAVTPSTCDANEPELALSAPSPVAPRALRHDVGEGWGEEDSPTSPQETPTRAKPKPLPGGSRHRKTLIQRLYDLFDSKLAEIEARVTSRTRLSRTDTESELRQFGALIKHFEQLTDLSDADAKSRATTPAADGAADAEHLRRDLVDRFAKLTAAAD